MAELNLQKKDIDNIPDRGLKNSDVLKEARSNHDELVDALLSINNTLREITQRLNDNPNLATSIEFNATSIENVEKKLLPALKEQINTNLVKVKTELLVEVKKNGQQIVDLEGHSRRKNVIVNGRDEIKGEDVEGVARQFMINDLHMEAEEVQKFIFRDVHRLPKPKVREDGRQFPKPIIIAFVSQKDRNSVMRKAFELKGTNLSLKSDLPKTLNDVRSNMLKERFNLKAANPGVKFRVGERGYKPVLQREDGVIPGTHFIKWSDIKFPAA